MNVLVDNQERTEGGMEPCTDGVWAVGSCGMHNQGVRGGYCSRK